MDGTTATAIVVGLVGLGGGGGLIYRFWSESKSAWQRMEEIVEGLQSNIKEMKADSEIREIEIRSVRADHLDCLDKTARQEVELKHQAETVGRLEKRQRALIKIVKRLAGSNGQAVTPLESLDLDDSEETEPIHSP